MEDEQLKSSFNGWMKNAMMLAFNEVAHDNHTRNSIKSKIKAIITDSEVMINEKNVKTYTVENHVNCLFFSNEGIPVLIESNDRRFNVVETGGNLQTQSWFNAEIVFQEIARELPRFAQYLMNFEYDAQKAKSVIGNVAKELMVNAGMNRFEEFASHLKKNDTEWFEENQQEGFGGILSINILNGKIEKEDAVKLFNKIYPDSKISVNTLSKQLQLYGIKVGRISREGNRVRCFEWEVVKDVDQRVKEVVKEKEA